MSKGGAQKGKECSEIGLMHVAIFLNDIFTEYSSKDGNPATLSKSECMQLIQERMTGLCDKNVDPKKLQTIMDVMNTNKDTEVDFMEFMIFFVKITALVHGMPMDKVTQ
ncbi:protein S100-P-like [Rhinatrema bivittatum]|uniref:protein S100-P-like n=1 Tax=Rhinatrema bivittatum TaxID=194408 RepID=UPI00112D1285|nr:protein S100-P-like [Rhinatrema bivittatum]